MSSSRLLGLQISRHFEERGRESGETSVESVAAQMSVPIHEELNREEPVKLEVDECLPVTSFLGGLSATVSISIVLDCTPHRKTVTLKRGKHDTCQLPVYFGNDDISGSISIEIKNSTKYEHMGLKCFLIGRLCHVQYLIRVALNRNIIGPVTEDCEFAVIKAT
ncbi:unnamed protein product [Sphagnum balticum]